MKKYLKYTLIFLYISLFYSVSALGQATTAQNVKNLLILNSYSEMSPWAKNMLTPIMVRAAMHEGVHVELTNLNSTLITDSITYNRIKANALSSYDDIKVDYVVFIGDLSFTLRDEIRDRWGDIPMLLITRNLTIAPDDYYFSGYDIPVLTQELPSVEKLRPEYNLGVIYVPDFYRETIDMMVDMIPDMDELVFFSDAIYFNRYLSRDIERYVMTEYPDIKFSWIKASNENSDEFNTYIVQRQPTKGLLLSSWLYAKMGPLGYPTIVSGDINVLHSSVNPVFSLREGYMSLGAIGGVYTNSDEIDSVITDYVQAMFDATQMRDLKIYADKNPHAALIDYPLLKKYDLDARLCPDNTIFVNKPLPFWKKYTWQAIVVILTFLLVVLILVKRNAIQKHKIETLTRHKKFVDNMPIPYSKGRVMYDTDMKTVLNITYTMSNQAFDDIIRENADPRSPYKLFTPEFISQKTSEMLESGKEVSFMQHFAKSDKYYIFTLCLVGTAKAKQRKVRGMVDTIDIFAIDITHKQKSEDTLKRLTRRLDMTLDVANLIPWEWDMLTDMMTIDAPNVFYRSKRTLDSNADSTLQSHVTFGEFMKLVHPDDRKVLRELRERLFLNEEGTFNVEYRILIAKKNRQEEEWVEIRGSISHHDDKGRPVAVMGVMTIVTERKQQQLAAAKSELKSIKAEEVKRDFVKNISHEIRVRLNAIIGFASLMSETVESTERQSFSKMIETNNQQLLEYIDSLVEESSKEPDQDGADDSNTPPVGQSPQTSPGQTAQEPKKPKAPNPITQGTEQAVKPKSEVSAHAKESPSPKKLILIAEDIEGNYLLLKNYIPKQYELLHAWTGQEAVDMFQQYTPDIVLMDIGMPVMNGYKATEEIRKMSQTVPIVAVTAYAANSDKELIMKSGFDDYITKPVMKPVILDTLSRFL